MNKQLIKEVVGLKLRLAQNLIEHLPPELGNELMEIGKDIKEAICEFEPTQHAQNSKKSNDGKGLNKIDIE